MSEIQTKINFKREILIEMPLMPKDECTEPNKNIIGEDCIDPSYQKKNQIRSPKGNLLRLSRMFSLSSTSMKYEAVRKSWPLSPQVDDSKTEQVALDNGVDKIWIGLDQIMSRITDWIKGRIMLIKFEILGDKPK